MAHFDIEGDGVAAPETQVPADEVQQEHLPLPKGERPPPLTERKGKTSLD